MKTKPKTHRHTAKTTQTRSFFGCVGDSERTCTPEAHGNVCHVEECTCGASREVNVNAGREERGAWQEVL